MVVEQDQPSFRGDLIPVGTYYVRVRTIVGASVSLPSNEVVVSITGCSGPPVPEISGSSSGQDVVVMWEDPRLTGCAADYAMIEAGRSPGATDVGRFPFSGTQQVQFRSVPEGEYYVRVRFVHNGVPGPASAELHLITECVPPPDLLDFRAEAVGNAARFDWRYGVERFGAGFTLSLEAGSSPGAADLATMAVPRDGNPGYHVAGVAGNFFTRLRAVNACGMSVSSEAAITLTSACIAPGPVPFITATNSNGRMFIEWESAAVPGLASAYTVNVGSAPGQSDLARLVVDGRLSNASGPFGHTYRQTIDGISSSPTYVSVTPANACGAGPRSFELHVGTCGGSPPMSLQVSTEAAQTRLTWTREDVGFDRDIQLEVGHALYSSDVLNQTVRSTYTNYSMLLDLPPGRYFARARYITSCGPAAPSREVMFVVAP
ncbi:MAG: hypothetical protein IT178_01260 [Acidobacteria bacterium]|nr:hypothetical protein [Acidobacteriota bacterium]